MKLSAPPPPPPEPPEPNDPGQEGAGAPQPPGEGQGGDANRSPELPGQPDAPKPLAWPAWFAGADFLLAVLVLALAFLVGSFVARNSDVWLHLAAGKRLVAGEYSPGSDPFSYSAADRTWVNHSILYDVGMYLLYSGSGMLLVLLKALAVAASFGLVLALRRTGFALWPWATVALVAVVATAPYTHLRPLVGSMLLFSLTLFLLFRGPHRPGSWRFPVAIGITFWVWANVDEWFFLGPLAVALVLAGELIQRALGSTADASNPGAGPEPLGSPPDVPTLAKALGIGLVACMLNPHHVGVWQLPMELTGAKGLTADLRLRQMLLSPLDEGYYTATGMGRANGYNHNGAAFALLFLAGGAALGLAGSRLRFAHLALWLGFALLSLQTIVAIPFLAILAVPLVASQLNALSANLTLRTWGDPRSRVLYLGSALGRVLVLVAAVVSCVLAWPGWIHPPVSNEAYARRVGWAVEPDESMRRGAEQLQAWRTGERPQLSDEARGLILSLEFANHCAWFAPSEKVYANSRYAHHRPELPTYNRARVAMGLVTVPPEQRPGPRDLSDLLAALGTEYVVTHSGPGDPLLSRELTQSTSMQQWLSANQWSPWYLDGRSTVCGWRSAPGSGRPSFGALRLDPLVLAFGPQKPLPQGSTTPAPARGGWEESFLRSPRVPPPGADEAIGWQMYKQARAQYAVLRDRAWDRLFVIGGALAGGWSATVAERASEINWLLAGRGVLSPVPDAESYAMPLLSLRAARRAIAADRDHPDGYWALFAALDDRDLPISDAERTLTQVAALKQCLQRLPPPDQYRAGVYLASPTKVSYILASFYLGRKREFGGVPMGVPVNHLAQVLNPQRGSGFLRAAVVPVEGQRGRPEPRWVGAFPSPPHDAPAFLLPLDEVRETLQLAQKYFRVEPPGKELLGAVQNVLAQRYPQLPQGLDELMQAFQKELDRELKEVEAELGRMNNAYDRRKAAAGGQMKLAAQVEAALEFNLVGEALQILTREDTDLGKEFGPRSLEVALSRTALQLALGRLEDAAATIDTLTSDPEVQQALSSPGIHPVVQILRFRKLVTEGNYPDAGAIMENLDGRMVGHDPAQPARQQFDPGPFVRSKQPLGRWAEFAQLSALTVPNPLDAVVRTFAPLTALETFSALRNDLAGIRQRDARFYTDRGLLSLAEGDIPAAKARFLQARPTAEQKAEDAKWGLPEYRHPLAERYLRLIDEAARRAQQK